MNIIIANIIGVLAVITFIISIQYTNKEKILKYQAISNILYAIEYFLLNVRTASYMNIISASRCYLYQDYHKKKKDIPLKYLYLFIILIIIITIFSYKNFLSLIPPLITIIYIISSYLKDTKYLRFGYIICAFIWIYYNISVNAYVSLIGNMLEILSGTISIIRNQKKLN